MFTNNLQAKSQRGRGMYQLCPDVGVVSSPDPPMILVNSVGSLDSVRSVQWAYVCVNSILPRPDGVDFWSSGVQDCVVGFSLVGY